MTEQTLSDKDFICDKSFMYDKQVIVILREDVREAVRKLINEFDGLPIIRFDQDVIISRIKMIFGEKLI